MENWQAEIPLAHLSLAENCDQWPGTGNTRSGHSYLKDTWRRRRGTGAIGSLHIYYSTNTQQEHLVPEGLEVYTLESNGECANLPARARSLSPGAAEGEDEDGDERQDGPRERPWNFKMQEGNTFSSSSYELLNTQSKY